MTGARINVSLDDKDYQQAVTKLGGVLHAGVMRPIGVALVEVVQQRFEAGREPFGAKWAPLNPAYAMIKRGPGILRASGMLQRFITFEVTGNRISVGSNRVYAAVHQFGATIKPKNARYLVFKLGGTGPRGGKITALVRAKAVTIPARPYLGFGPADQKAVMGVLALEVSKVWRS